MTEPTQPDYVGGLPAGCLLNEYQIERVLGHGGFGVTYLARDSMLQKAVAIKEYLPIEWAVRINGNTVSVRSSADRQAFEQGMASFLNEARVLARFTHPNLIGIYRYFQANSTAYFVMEYAEGDTLRAVVKKERSLPEQRIKQMFLPILEGLEGVHQAGILHRDIKPENILVRKGGNAVLIDFGAARYTMGSKSRAITSVLTPGYAPIEQYSTSSSQGPWTDIYALGAVIYYSMVGRKPFDAVARMHDDPLVPAALAGKQQYSEDFLACVDWALRVKAEERPQSLGAWRGALNGQQPAPRFAHPRTTVGDITRPGGSIAASAGSVAPIIRSDTPERVSTPPSQAPARDAPPPAPVMTAPFETRSEASAVSAGEKKSTSRWLPVALAGGLLAAGVAAVWWMADKEAAVPAIAEISKQPPAAPPAADPELARRKQLQQPKPAAQPKQLEREKRLVEQKRQEQERLQAQQREQERLAAQKREDERLAAQKREQVLAEQKEKAEAERQAAAEAERKRLAEEKARRETQQREQERLAAEERAQKAEAERQAKLKAKQEAERKAEQEKKKETEEDDATIGW